MENDLAFADECIGGIVLPQHNGLHRKIDLLIFIPAPAVSEKFAGVTVFYRNMDPFALPAFAFDLLKGKHLVVEESKIVLFIVPVGENDKGSVPRIKGSEFHFDPGKSGDIHGEFRHTAVMSGRGEMVTHFDTISGYFHFAPLRHGGIFFIDMESEFAFHFT